MKIQMESHREKFLVDCFSLLQEDFTEGEEFIRESGYRLEYYHSHLMVVVSTSCIPLKAEMQVTYEVTTNNCRITAVELIEL